MIRLVTVCVTHFASLMLAVPAEAAPHEPAVYTVNRNEQQPVVAIKSLDSAFRFGNVVSIPCRDVICDKAVDYDAVDSTGRLTNGKYFSIEPRDGSYVIRVGSILEVTEGRQKSWNISQEKPRRFPTVDGYDLIEADLLKDNIFIGVWKNRTAEHYLIGTFNGVYDNPVARKGAADFCPLASTSEQVIATGAGDFLHYAFPVSILLRSADRKRLVIANYSILSEERSCRSKANSERG